jgi:hypothetical protein
MKKLRLKHYATILGASAGAFTCYALPTPPKDKVLYYQMSADLIHTQSYLTTMSDGSRMPTMDVMPTPIRLFKDLSIAIFNTYFDREYLFFEEKMGARNIRVGTEWYYSSAEQNLFGNALRTGPIGGLCSGADQNCTDTYYSLNTKDPRFWPNQAKLAQVLKVDHGACSVETKWRNILDSAATGDGTDNFFTIFSRGSTWDEMYPYDTQMKSFTGTSFISDDGKSGGIMIRNKVHLDGSSLVNFFKIPIQAIEGASLVGTSDYDVTTSLRGVVGLDSTGLVTFGKEGQKVSLNSTQTCGLIPVSCLQEVAGICIIPGPPNYRLCPDSQVESGVHAKASEAIASGQAQFQECQFYPVSYQQDAAGNDLYQDCTQASDCQKPGSAGPGKPNSIGALLTGLAPGAVQLAMQETGNDSAIVQQFGDKVKAQVADPKNYRCAPITQQCAKFVGVPPSPLGKRVCKFALRAKRINYLPDTLELVWADSTAYDPNDVTSAGALAFILSKLENVKDPNSRYQKLCNQANSIAILNRKQHLGWRNFPFIDKTF